MPAVLIEMANRWLPAGLDGLAAQAASENIRVVANAVSRWRDGSECYDGPGELLCVAVDSERDLAIGLGGMTRCPDVTGALRMRRFYVAPAYRRHGVARCVARRLIESADGATTTLTCNARASAGAGQFWESMGFERVELPGVTHLRHLTPGTS